MASINPVIMNFIMDNGNLITTADVISLGFSKQLLLKYVKDGLLERVRQGTYILPNNVHDDMYTLMLRSPHIIFFTQYSSISEWTVRSDTFFSLHNITK